MKAKDSNIIQALIDLFAKDTPNKGKGTKKEPGYFYGFKKRYMASNGSCLCFSYKVHRHGMLGGVINGGTTKSVLCNHSS